jgi:hypothetical protein
MTTSKMFTFTEDVPGRTMLWPCTISVPLNGGLTEERLLVARFLLDHIAEKAHEALIAEANAALVSVDTYITSKVLVGFDAFTNEGGTTIPDDAAIAFVMAKPFAVSGLMKGYMEMRAGRAAKNSVTPSATS